jgi:hypothetical protein
VNGFIFFLKAFLSFFPVSVSVRTPADTLTAATPLRTPMPLREAFCLTIGNAFLEHRAQKNTVAFSARA